jgi:hypothetical protein
MDVFAYDLDEPDVVSRCSRWQSSIACASSRWRGPAHRNRREADPRGHLHPRFISRARNDDAIKRRKFGRYAHDKVFIVSDGTGPRTVLTGSTNFSVSGMYVNANHVLVFDDRDVAGIYSGVFNQAWDTDVKQAAFAQSRWGTDPFPWGGAGSSAIVPVVVVGPGCFNSSGQHSTSPYRPVRNCTART